MIHTFNKEEYKEFIKGRFYKEGYSENFEYIDDLYNSSMYWERKICGLNHFLSIVLEQFIKLNKNPNEIIDFVYSCSDISDFEIQETTEWFIDSLYDNLLTPGLTLEEYLIIVQNKLK